METEACPWCGEEFLLQKLAEHIGDCMKKGESDIYSLLSEEGKHPEDPDSPSLVIEGDTVWCWLPKDSSEDEKESFKNKLFQYREEGKTLKWMTLKEDVVAHIWKCDVCGEDTPVYTYHAEKKYCRKCATRIPPAEIKRMD